MPGNIWKRIDSLRRRGNIYRGEMVGKRMYCPVCLFSTTSDDLYRQHYREAHTKKIAQHLHKKLLDTTSRWVQTRCAR